MVRAGTRYAAAIYFTVNPATARRDSVTCDGRLSAGWQHRISSRSVSSPSGPGPAGQHLVRRWRVHALPRRAPRGTYALGRRGTGRSTAATAPG
jgi:hypothetical protein